jgi:hemolysin activation/secretion protein
VDRTAVGETGDRTVRVLNLAAGGEVTRSTGTLPGVYSFSLSLNLGHADQHNETARAADAAGRRTQGRYAKLAWNLGLQRPLTGHWTLQATLVGQFADTNLDSSERFGLGGPSGVRAYPVSEASGDTGWLANLSLSRPLGAQWTFSGFVDGGEVTVNRRPTPVPQTTPNRYGLSGAGLGLDWRPSPQWVLKTAVATPIGHNPGAQADGTNSDGRRNTTRVWLSLAAQF